MAKRNLGEKIKLSTYDEMFGTDTFGHDDQKSEGQIINVPLSELYTFKNHPFKVLDDEKNVSCKFAGTGDGPESHGLRRQCQNGGVRVNGSVCAYDGFLGFRRRRVRRGLHGV